MSYAFTTEAVDIQKFKYYLEIVQVDLPKVIITHVFF